MTKHPHTTRQQETSHATTWTTITYVTTESAPAALAVRSLTQVMRQDTTGRACRQAVTERSATKCSCESGEAHSKAVVATTEAHSIVSDRRGRPRSLIDRAVAFLIEDGRWLGDDLGEMEESEERRTNTSDDYSPRRHSSSPSAKLSSNHELKRLSTESVSSA